MKKGKLAVHNIYKCADTPKGKESFETLLERGGFKIEKIVSNGAASPEGFWYDQKQDEFIVLLSGKAGLLFESGETVLLKPGDYMFIPSRVKHRVEYTSSKPKCVWLAVHGEMLKNSA